MGTDDSPHVCTRFSPLPFFALAPIPSSRSALIRDLALIQHRLYQKIESVPISIEDTLPVIASLGNMMNHTLKDNPCSPGHTITSQNERLTKNRD